MHQSLIQLGVNDAFDDTAASTLKTSLLSDTTASSIEEFDDSSRESTDESKYYAENAKYQSLFTQNSKEKENQKPDFQMRTSFFGQIIMLDMFRLIMRSASRFREKRILEVDDLPRQSQSSGQVDYFYARMKCFVDAKLDEAKKKKQSIMPYELFSIIVKTFSHRICLMYSLMILSYSTQFVSSYMIEKLVKSVSARGSQSSSASQSLEENVQLSSDPYVYALGLTISSMLHVAFAHNWLRMNEQILVLFRNAFVRIIYGRITALSSFDVKSASIGKLINLVSGDFNTIESKVNEIAQIFNIPLYAITLIIILCIRLGAISLIGLGITLLICPLQMFLSRMQSKLFEEKSKISDERVVMTNEIIEGIRLLKMYAWEEAFVRAINVVRNQEVQENFKLRLIQFFNYSLSMASGLVGSLCTFYLVYKFGDEGSLDTATIFSTFYLFQQVRFEIVATFGQGILGLFEFRIILRRMISVLMLQKSSMKSIDSSQKSENLKEGTLAKLVNFSAYWSQEKPVLSNLTAEFKRGECVCILGKVGAGKTSLLNCFLKEIPLYSGQIQSKGKIAYVEQEPYIFSTSIRDNITFGMPFEQKRYDSVLEQCCLLPDIQSMPLGDETIIGERGIDISGGQKARLSLARAVYSQADLYLLDDPLSAVDSKVAKKLFFGAIQNLTKSACVILVTHQIHFSQFANQVILLSDGKISAQGTFSDIKSSLQGSYGTLTNFESEQLQSEAESATSESNEISIESTITSQSTLDSSKINSQKPNEMQTAVEVSTEVNFQSYWTLFKISRVLWLTPVIVFSYFMSDLMFVFFNRQQRILGENISERPTTFQLMAIFALSYFCVQCIKQIMIAILINQGCKNLHEQMLSTLIRAPSSYYDKTPSGKIINLFSNDLSTVDSVLSGNLQEASNVASTFFVMTIVVVIVQPYFLLIVMVEIAVLWAFVRRTSCSLKATKQLDISLRSPVFTFFNQAIAGVLPIRVFEQQSRFESQFNELTSNSSRASMYYYLCQRGFGAYIAAIGFSTSMIGILFVMITVSDSSLLSATIIFLMSSIEDLQWGIRQMIQADVTMTSTQRCLDLSKIEQEAPLKTQYDSNLRKSSLSKNDVENGKEKTMFKGELVFRDVKMRYQKHLDYVLKGVSFDIKPGQRVGIVGRTGAGKSSILQCLFRMVEIEKVDEQSGVWIDGLDARMMGLHTLRSGISIIPQLPLIFAGTIRKNLDPQDEYTNQQINETLVNIGLDQKVKSFEKGIDTNMTNVNSIFSIGEKQLICLGRAILKNSRLIVLDEATANCDLHTDEFIQANLRDKFKQSTLITIAHRLNTIADYDKIIVIDQGQVVETGTPFELLSEGAQRSIFAKMVEHTGESNAALIYEIAKKQEQQTRNVGEKQKFD